MYVVYVSLSLLSLERERVEYKDFKGLALRDLATEVILSTRSIIDKSLQVAPLPWAAWAKSPDPPLSPIIKKGPMYRTIGPLRR